MIKINFNKAVASPFQLKDIEHAANSAADLAKKLIGEVEVNIVGEKEIKKLNKQFRGIDKVTDVLSFPWAEKNNKLEKFLGQIYICYPKIVAQAKEFKVTAREEFMRMFIHGLLHLIGYDHLTGKEADAMFALQEKIVRNIYGN